MPTPFSMEERRRKREERRIKQREQNILRAQKMHKARLADKTNIQLLSDSETNMKHACIGCSGWFYWHWRGLFYPEFLPTNQWFPHYRKHFSTVELNASFYGWPTVATVKSWRKQVEGMDFVYTVKVNELITHIKKFKGTKTLVADFGYIADLLGPHMGCFLFQLPPSYHYSPANLKAITSQLDPSRRNVVEFRHASWWRKEVYAAFRKHGIIFCSSSAPRLPDELIKTAEDVYIRFHGKERWYRYDYSKKELAVWAERIRECAPAHSWVYFNNDREGYAISNAGQFAKQLKKRPR